MDFLRKFEEICSKNDCCLEYVGDDAPLEYVGFENCLLVFALDAKEGEFDLIILHNPADRFALVDALNEQNNIPESIFKVRLEFEYWVSKGI